MRGLLTEYGVVLAALLAMPVLLVVAGAFVAAVRRFEVALALLFVSPWIHWCFASNVENLEKEAGRETGAATYLRLGMVLLVGVAGYLRFADARREEECEPLPPRFLLLGLFTAGALLSTVYSIARPFTSVRALEALIFFGFLLGLYCWLKGPSELDRLLNILVGLVSVAIVLNLASLVLMPGRVWWWQSPNRFLGLMNQPNELGMFCMLSYPLLMWRYRRSGPGAKAAVAMLLLAALGMHVLSGSRSSFLCASLGFLIWHITLRQRGKALALALAILMGGAVASSSLVPSLERHESEDLTDLTGRPEFWRNGMALVMERPLFGYGYQVSGMVWNDPRFATAQLENSWSSARASLHNGYLDTLIGLGAVGLSAWLVILLMPLPAALRLPKSDYKAVALVVMFQLLPLNFVETIITSSRSYSSIVFWCFWVICGSLPVIVGHGEPELAFEQAQLSRPGADETAAGVAP